MDFFVLMNQNLPSFPDRRNNCLVDDKIVVSPDLSNSCRTRETALKTRLNADSVVCCSVPPPSSSILLTMRAKFSRLPIYRECVAPRCMLGRRRHYGRKQFSEIITILLNVFMHKNPKIIVMSYKKCNWPE